MDTTTPVHRRPLPVNFKSSFESFIARERRPAFLEDTTRNLKAIVWLLLSRYFPYSFWLDMMTIEGCTSYLLEQLQQAFPVACGGLFSLGLLFDVTNQERRLHAVTTQRAGQRLTEGTLSALFYICAHVCMLGPTACVLFDF